MLFNTFLINQGRELSQSFTVELSVYNQFIGTPYTQAKVIKWMLVSIYTIMVFLCD